MTKWSEPLPLPKGMLDPSTASLLVLSDQSAQPRYLDVAQLAEQIAGFGKNIAEAPEQATAELFSQLADAVLERTEVEEGFVRLPRSNKKSGLHPSGLLGPVISRDAIHGADGVAEGFEAFSGGSPFRAPQQTVQKSIQKSSPYKAAAGKTVAMGIADFSIAFLNRRFRKADGYSRFEMLWIQDRVPLDTFKPMFPTYTLLGLGTFLMRHDIDALIDHFTKNGVLDEDAAYGAFSKPPLGMQDSWALREGHGTAILDHMAGADPGTHDTDRPLYGVELPTSVLLDTSGQQLLPPLLLGLAAIAVTSLFFSPAAGSAGMIAGAPLVINASLAFTGGPDNGTGQSGFATLLGDTMTALQTLPHESLALTIPTGNHRQDRVHGRLAGGRMEHIAWGLPPDDLTPSSVEIFVRDGTPLEQFELTLPGAAPLTLSASAIPAPGFYADLVQNGQIIARLAHPTGFGPDHYTLTVAPTARRDMTHPVAPSGTWGLGLKSCGAAIDLWVRRDDRLEGFNSTGRQSWFVDAAYLLLDDDGDLLDIDVPRTGAPALKVHREGTGSVLLDALNGGANGIIGVAGLQNGGSQPYRFSGARRAPNAQSVEAAVAEVSRLRGGPIAAARRSGTVTRPAGTSIASAIYARQFADTI
ncbi:hypothetical protein [uncultured Sulfitobacter sp.]|uniref:hypothetical protein n=1 Tax=uncultured Sulfitobacter sp. TaxID=191468 RepID=UPI00261EF93E|nr:hypothetical protein [uncultured Sulfitobacter sp.]